MSNAIISNLLHWRSLLEEGSARLSEGPFSALSPASTRLHKAAFGMNAVNIFPGTKLIWVEEEMVDLVQATAPTVPAYTWTPKVLPWPKAILVGQKPFMRCNLLNGGTTEIHALQWSDYLSFEMSPSMDAEGAKRHGLDWGRIRGAALRQPGACICSGWQYQPNRCEFPVPQGVFSIKEGASTDNGTIHVSDASEEEILKWQNIVGAVWALLHQWLAIKQTLPVGRTFKKLAQKAGESPIDRITIVRLRQPDYVAGNAGTRSVEWSHRWVVGRFWRNQWHPSKGLHIPTLILDYVKGPKNKPLLIKPRFGKWDR